MFDGSGFTGLKQRDTSGISACNYHKCPAGGAVAPGIHLHPIQKPVVLHQFVSVCWDVLELGAPCLADEVRDLWCCAVKNGGSDMRVKIFSIFWIPTALIWHLCWLLGSTTQQHLLSLSLKEPQSSEHLTFCLTVFLSFLVSFCLSIFNSFFCSFFTSFFTSFCLSFFLSVPVSSQATVQPDGKAQHPTN